MDRFARNRYDSAHYKAALRKNGVKVISATEVISEGAEGIILESVLEGYAEYYSAELSEKVIRGMTENALKCQFNGGGVTIGYMVDENKNNHLDPLIAPFIKDAFEMYAGGKTVKEIVIYLNGKGVRSSQGKPMSKTSVTAMLKNVKYKGQYKYRDVVIDDGVPRIVSDELFQLAQERLVKNQYSRSRFKAKVEYFLSTKLFCGECGSLMVGESGTSRNDRKYNYYKCANVKRKGGCHKKSVRKEIIEDLVLNEVMNTMFTDEMISEIADKVIALRERENTAIPLLNERLSEVNQRIDNLINAMEMGIVTKSTKAHLDELESQRGRIESDILKEQIQRDVLSREQIEFWLRSMKNLDLTNDDNKRRLVDTFVNSVYLYDDNKAVVSFNCREGASTLVIPAGECSACARLGEPNRTKENHLGGSPLFVFYLGKAVFGVIVSRG